MMGIELVGFQAEEAGVVRQKWINPRFVVEVYEADGGEVAVVMVGGRWFTVAEPLAAVVKILRGMESE